MGPPRPTSTSRYRACGSPAGPSMLEALKIEESVPPVARARTPPWDDDAQVEFEVA